MHRLPRAWVTRTRCGRRVECALTDRGRAIVNCEIPARITGEGPYVGLRGRPNLATAFIRREHFGTDLKPLRFPDETQDFVDACVSAMGSEDFVDRNAALDRLTSWLEVGERAHANLLDKRTWRRAVTPARLGELAAARCAISQPTPGEQVDQLRATLKTILAGDGGLIDADAAVHVVFPLRSRTGEYAVLGGLFAAGGLSNPTPLTWDGLFRRSDDFLTWLADERGLIPSLGLFNALAYVDQLAIWPAGSQ